jgi:ribose-phosphate pyrophosphokinase
MSKTTVRRNNTDATLPVIWMGSGSRYLTESLKKRCDFVVADSSERTFPDGEVLVSASTCLKDRTVVILQGTHPPQDRNLQVLYQMIDVAAHEGARRIVCVVPYLAYARQDRRCNRGDALSSRLVLKTLEMLGVRALATFDVHNEDIFAYSSIEGVSLSAAPLIAAFLKGLHLPDPVVLAPDTGAVGRATSVAKLTGWPKVCWNKQKTANGVTTYEGVRNEGVRRRDVVVIDDCCSSGSTLLPLLDRLAGCSASSAHYFVTHFLADAAVLVKRAPLPLSVSATDAVPNECVRVSIANIIADWIEEHSSEWERAA